MSIEFRSDTFFSVIFKKWYDKSKNANNTVNTCSNNNDYTHVHVIIVQSYPLYSIYYTIKQYRSSYMYILAENAIKYKANRNMQNLNITPNQWNELYISIS